MANVPITSLPEATAPNANDYLILQGSSTQKIKWSALLDKLYPVGCIYQSAGSTSPASFLGGTWEQIAKGRVLMGASDTHAAGTTVEAGLPDIEGSLGIWYWGVQSASGAFEQIALKGTVPRGEDTEESGSAGASFKASGSNPVYGNADTVQPPAYYVYIWQRIA